MDKIEDHLIISKGVNFKTAVLILSTLRFLKGSSHVFWEESGLAESEREHLTGDKKRVLDLFREKIKLG